jgi:hypothetical protein
VQTAKRWLGFNNDSAEWVRIMSAHEDRKWAVVKQERDESLGDWATPIV